MKKTKAQMVRPFLYALLTCSIIQGVPAFAEILRLQRDGPIARDYFNKLEWMRCSIGQVWQDETCIFTPSHLRVLHISTEPMFFYGTLRTNLTLGVNPGS
mgnify:CR=1 FL=1